MKSLYGMTMVAALGMATVLGFTLRGGSAQVSRVDMASNGAYRDGLYVAKLDEQWGRTAHVRTGRWSTDADRASFLLGYQDGSERLRAASGEDRAGFRQGLNDGAQARRADRPFALRTDLRAGTTAEHRSSDEQNEFALSYADGYQVGYYTEARTLESELNAGQGGNL